MKVALLQIRFAGNSPAANIQRIASAIDRAARVVPAPDVLVLPGACDTGGGPIKRGFPIALLESIREGIACKAREWGVFIVAGLHRDSDDGFRPWAVLFDPDGDVVRGAVSSSSPGEAEPNVTVKLWHSAIGDLGVFDPTVVSPVDGAVAASACGAFVAIPLCLARSAKKRRAGEEHLMALRQETAARSGAYWGVAVGVGQAGRQSKGKPAVSFACSPGGNLLAIADTGDETVVYAEVPIAAAPEGPTETFGEGHDAD